MEEQKHADPSALGLFGLALVTMVASSQKLGFTEGTLLIIPWALFLGGFAQLIAGILDFKKRNVFGGTAFTSYGFFWIATALVWTIQFNMSQVGTPELADGKQLAFAYLGYLIFTLFMTVAAVEANKTLLVIFCLIDVLFFGLTFYSFGIMAEQMHFLAGLAELGISIASFYGAAANMFKVQFGYELLPIGKPLGIFKK